MKTPREILLARHQDAEPKLDEVRARALASLSQPPQQAGESFALRMVLAFWRELILPCRRVWGGLAAAWVVIIGLSLCTGGEPRAMTGKSAPLDPDAATALREQRQILAQLLDATPTPAAAHPQAPGPRGDVRRAVAVA
jgi:hypothetical protein